MYLAPRKWIGRALLSALVVAMAGVAVPNAGAQVAGGDPVFSDTTAGIHLWAPMHEPGGRFHSLAEAIAVAKRYDLITIRPGQLGTYAAAMRAANPNLRIYVYMNGTYLYRGLLGAVPQSAMAHTASGALIQSKGFHNWLGNPTAPAWLGYKQQECLQLIVSTETDGCYLDMLGAAPTTPGYGTGIPIDPKTGQPWTGIHWIQDTAGLAADIAGYSRAPVLSNGLGDGRKFFGHKYQSRILMHGAWGSTAETWLKKPGGGPTSYEGKFKWYQDVTMLTAVNSIGRVALTMTKMWGGGSPAQKESWREYALASFLLGNSGHSYFYFSADRGEHATVDSPLYHLPIGTPLGPMEKYVDGVWQRPFSNGLVVVNATGSPATLPLTQSYQTSDGKLVSSSLAMPPDTGQILTKAR